MMHFSHDYELGIKYERERIITLLEDLAAGQQKVIEFNPDRGDNDLRHAVCSAFYQVVALLKECK